MSKRLNIGVLAHVDAGKTTLAEAMLYISGVLRSLGRVDHQDAFLDHFALERERGITIFSKLARFSWGDLEVTLLDTPGHVDFSAEMERTLQVMDIAVLVVSGPDGIQGHTMTLWGLLKKYQIPTFLFVNKMDQEGTEPQAILALLREKLGSACMQFGAWDRNKAAGNASCNMEQETTKEDQEAFYDGLTLCSEELLEEYLETGSLCEESIAEAILAREVFPVYFGAALRLQGVEALLDGLEHYTLEPLYPEEFGARVFKIARDKQGNRMTYLKVTGGILRAKQMVGNPMEGWEEKVDQIRSYNGVQFQTLSQVQAGEICEVTGLSKTYVGQGLGYEQEKAIPSLEPVLTYGLKLPPGSDPVIVLGYLRRLEEEEPLLHVVWKEAVKEIHVQVMGQVQTEILQELLLERYGLDVGFEDGSIVYKETLAEPVLGVGHFEPLRHYAEVQLLLEPGERGSGLTFGSIVSEDELDRNWQRLILTHLEERSHPGVLTGSEITDLKITLVAGRAHPKHTEGGDFRQATYRAVRQGLSSGKNVLLEPVYGFSLELPTECLGRAMTDIQRMQGRFDTPDTRGEICVLTGVVPVAQLGEYQREVISYTRGRGKLSVALRGYEPCHNAPEVVSSIGYDPEADQENPAGSVFCAHGAGFLVPWDRVTEYAHLPLQKEYLVPGALEAGAGKPAEEGVVMPITRPSGGSSDIISQEEIDAIFRQGNRNYNRKAGDKQGYRRYHRGARREEYGRSRGRTYVGSEVPKERCLLVDGYNIIFAWPALRELAQVNMDSARDRLIDELSNYQGYVGGVLILVYDAYKVRGGAGAVQKLGNIYVVYTKEAETADQYIEKTVHQIASKYRVTVATSDGLEQKIVWGAGASRMSALGLFQEMESARAKAREQYGIT